MPFFCLKKFTQVPLLALALSEPHIVEVEHIPVVMRQSPAACCSGARTGLGGSNSSSQFLFTDITVRDLTAQLSSLPQFLRKLMVETQ